MRDVLDRIVVRGALVGSSVLQLDSFWAQAAMGRNQMFLHQFGEGEISIGKVSEQLYSEGFLGAWHTVLEREVGLERAAAILQEVGTLGARWEIEQAVAHGVWVPVFLRPYLGTTELRDRARSSALWHGLTKQTLLLVFHMIMAEGGWGVVEDVHIASDPLVVKVRNTAESRQGTQGCHVALGIFRAYMEALFGVTCTAHEATCRSRGDDCCTFVYEPVAAAEELAPVEAASA